MAAGHAQETSPPDPPPGSPEPTRAGLAFRLHRLGFILTNGILTLANIYTGSPWWAFWPLIVWGAALMVHFLFHRAMSVDDAWVEERTEDLRAKSYDLAHIDSIRAHAGQTGTARGHREPAMGPAPNGERENS